MEIKRNSSLVADVWVQNTSYVNEEIMGDHTLSLDFLTLNPIELEVGDEVEFEGTTYAIRHKEKITKRQTSRGWEYNVLFYAPMYRLQDVPFFLLGSPEFLKNGDYYTGTSTEWLSLIIKNMNREDSGWSAGSVIESEWITLSFKDKQCSDVLDDLCSQLDTEYSVSGKVISIGRVEYASNGLKLGQGQGMGFTELSLESSDQERPTTVIYPYGGDRNLPEGYGSDYLLMPGKAVSLEMNVEKYGRCARKVQFEGVYPKGDFTVTSVIDEFTFTATGIDFDISGCLIQDQEVTVSFQSGALAGYDLAIAEDGWDNTTKQIKVIQNEEENALKVPGDIHIAVGDRFTLFNLRMPQSYVTKAEQELKAKAEAWLSKKSEKLVKLRGKCDDTLFRQNKIHVACGQMVMIVDERLGLEREIRCTKTRRYIENNERPYRYELTLSDYLDTNGFKDFVKEVENTNEEIKKELKPLAGWTKRAWRDVMETFDMMFDPEGEYFTEKIKPLAIQTAQLIVGTNSGQMDFIGVTFQPNKNGNPNLFGNTSGRLDHFTIDQTGVRSWSISAGEYTLDGSSAYYVYAKCSRTGDTGSILCSTSQIKLEDDADYYHFWVGVLNSPNDGSRSWAPMYGFTEITGQYITTGVIKSKTGKFVIDLDKEEITSWAATTDKPDMTQYATVSWTNGQISGVSKKVDDLGNEIELAGFVTKFDGNKLWASKTLEDGSTIISKINQTATTVTIDASHIALTGAVTFSMFHADLKGKINGIDDTASAAYSNASTALSDATSALNKAVAAAKDASDAVSDAAAAKSDAAAAIADAAAAVEKAGSVQGAIDALPAWSKKAKIIDALTDEAVMVGSYLNIKLIDVDNLYATHLDATVGTIAGFTLSANTMAGSGCTLESGGAIKFSSGNRWAAYGVYGLEEIGGLSPLAAIWNKDTNSGDKYGLYIRCDGYDVNENIRLQYSASGSFKKTILGFRHYSGGGTADDQSFKRALIQTDKMPFSWHVEKTYGAVDGKHVMYDLNSGVFYVIN